MDVLVMAEVIFKYTPYLNDSQIEEATKGLGACSFMLGREGGICAGYEGWKQYLKTKVANFFYET